MVSESSDSVGKIGVSDPWDRDSAGRFAPGNRGGGRPPSPVKKLRDQIAKWEKDLGGEGAVAQILVTKALAGDTAAIKILLEYSFGKPGLAEGEQPDQPAIAVQINNYLQNANNPSKVRSILERVPEALRVIEASNENAKETAEAEARENKQGQGQAKEKAQEEDA